MAPPSPGPGEPRRPLTRKLTQWIALSPAEVAVLGELQAPVRTVPRNREIITEGRNYDGLFVLIDGIAIRYRVLHDGRRQILNVALPGDLIGFPACFFESALYSVTALADSIVAAISFAELHRLFEDYPRLGAAIFWLFSCEAAMYAEHLIDVGRRSARERVAHFLLELLTRLQAIGLADECSFQMPLTQELVGDALGLSIPHVNRTLRQLRAEGLLGIEGQTVTINDFEALAALADFEKTYLSRFRISGFVATI